MGTFQDKTSMDRILFAVFTHENKSQGVSTPVDPSDRRWLDEAADAGPPRRKNGELIEMRDEAGRQKPNCKISAAR
jgi:hypothetical protein